MNIYMFDYNESETYRNRLYNLLYNTDKLVRLNWNIEQNRRILSIHNLLFVFSLCIFQVISII